MMTASQPAIATTARRGVLARYFNEFRIAAYLLVFYALSHTFGAVINTPRFGAESDAVVASMKAVHVVATGADCTWYGFFRGFGAFVTIFFALSVYVAWRLGGANIAERRSLLPIGWALVVSHAFGAALAVAYFFPAPMAFSGLVTALLALGCVRSWRALGNDGTRMDAPAHPAHSA
jgi:hypothetical protein